MKLWERNINWTTKDGRKSEIIYNHYYNLKPCEVNLVYVDSEKRTEFMAQIKNYLADMLINKNPIRQNKIITKTIRFEKRKNNMNYQRDNNEVKTWSSVKGFSAGSIYHFTSIEMMKKITDQVFVAFNNEIKDYRVDFPYEYSRAEEMNNAIKRAKMNGEKQWYATRIVNAFSIFVLPSNKFNDKLKNKWEIILMSLYNSIWNICSEAERKQLIFDIPINVESLKSVNLNVNGFDCDFPVIWMPEFKSDEIRDTRIDDLSFYDEWEVMKRFSKDFDDFHKLLNSFYYILKKVDLWTDKNKNDVFNIDEDSLPLELRKLPNLVDFIELFSKELELSIVLFTSDKNKLDISKYQHIMIGNIHDGEIVVSSKFNEGTNFAKLKKRFSYFAPEKMKIYQGRNDKFVYVRGFKEAAIFSGALNQINKMRKDEFKIHVLVLGKDWNNLELDDDEFILDTRKDNIVADKQDHVIKTNCERFVGRMFETKDFRVLRPIDKTFNMACAMNDVWQKDWLSDLDKDYFENIYLNILNVSK
jgi:hypothetical protein